jgi:azurin
MTLMCSSSWNSAGRHPCKVTIESNDLMQFNAHEMAVPVDCADVEVTLRNAGKLPAAVMGHDWVLAKDSFMFGGTTRVAQARKSGFSVGASLQHGQRRAVRLAEHSNSLGAKILPRTARPTRGDG